MKTDSRRRHHLVHVVILSSSVSYSNVAISPELFKFLSLGTVNEVVFKNLPLKSPWALYTSEK
jgi:hypothetical protein